MRKALSICTQHNDVEIYGLYGQRGCLDCVTPKANTPDQILEQFSNHVYSVAPDFYPTENMKFMETAEAKEALYQLILTKVIGENGTSVARLINRNSILMTGRDINASINLENNMKHKQRQAAAKLFNKEKE